MTAEQIVHESYPEAISYPIDFGFITMWEVSADENDKPLGIGKTELEAWEDAAEYIETGHVSLVPIFD